MSQDQNSFLYSANADFIAELFQRYATNPTSIDISWRSFFDGLNQDARVALQEMKGASWAPATTAKVIANENETPVPTAPRTATSFAKAAMASPEPQQEVIDSIRAVWLIRAYRQRAHLMAKLDPLGLAPIPSPEDVHLDLKGYGFEDGDYDRPIFLNGTLGLTHSTLRNLIDKLQTIYCGTVGYEFSHIQNYAEVAWLQARIEERTASDNAAKRRTLSRLTAGDAFEKFLATKFVGVKRFGLEGGEAMIPGIEAAITCGANMGLREVVVGMAHRGRLNTLTNIMGKSFTAMFSEFQGNPAYPDSVQGSGDVKYHLGTSIDRDFAGKTVHLTMNPNPSHLEWVNPVVMGRVRAKQQQRSDNTRLTDDAIKQVMALLIHGDAAFAGQGIVAESLLLAELKGYRVGGTFHFVINNQVGFTTSPQYSRSGTYCTDIAKMIQAPIFHVNGDDVDAVVHVCEVAAAYRQTFGRDVVIDMVCYRRNGHNEGDEPAFTQPVMYKTIRAQPTTREVYVARLVADGTITQAEADQINSDFLAQLEKDFQASTAYKPNKADWLEGKWQGLEVASGDDRNGKTGVALDILREVGTAIARVPQGFDLNPKIAKQLEAKHEMMVSGEGIDWATAEALAFGTLLTENIPVRLSGQDCGRGTFSQRHSVLVDQRDESRYVPLNGIRADQATYDVHDSPLSEAAVMGFDYGFSLAEPNMLVCWEGQFGDFANTAQVIVDQFISSSESKWLRMSGITLLLPHGYEGQGPEHSSARLERYLQMCGEDNMQVANCSTPANYFHVLRRQVRRNFRKPLILMTPKSLLRNKMCVSKLADMAENSSFLSVIPETSATMADDKRIRRVVVCSGKIYCDLLAARDERKINDVALVRLEQFYPFPLKHLAAELARYARADEVVWCQEEPENMGAWSFLDRRIEEALTSVKHRVSRPKYIGRPAMAATATGSMKRHTKEQADIMERAFSK